MSCCVGRYDEGDRSERERSVFGLELRDIDFDNEQVHIRPNVWRTLKRARHKRTVPLWPQLSRILKPYIAGLGRDTGLLFASPSGVQRMSRVMVVT